jgi:ion channel
MGFMVEPNEHTHVLDTSTALTAIFVVTAMLISQVLRSGSVTSWRVQGAIAAYLCIGFGWANAYHLAALLDPGAFNVAKSDVWVRTNWINYSFGMLTTVGYAGIVPATPVAHSLGSAEAVTGQLYLVVLLARLVSMQISTAGDGADESSTPTS